MPERWNVKSVIIETTDGPAIRCAALFAGFLWRSDMPWILACGRVASGFILLEYCLIGRSVAITLSGKSSVVARRASGDSSAGCAAFDSSDPPRHYFSANVPRQQSLAGGAGGSHGAGAKALGLLFCQQALCLSGGTSNRRSSKQPAGSRWVGCLVGPIFCFFCLVCVIQEFSSSPL